MVEYIIKSMEQRLLNISKALAQSAIDGYNHHATYMYATANGVGDVTRAVYNELVIGAKAKSKVWKLSKNVTKVALIAYWRSLSYSRANEAKILNVENDTLFSRANMAVHATLKKMIRETNYQRRLAQAMSF